MIIDGEESNSSPLYFLQKVINMELSKIILTPTAIMITDYDYGSCPSLEYNFKSYDPLTHKIEIMGNDAIEGGFGFYPNHIFPTNYDHQYQIFRKEECI